MHAVYQGRPAKATPLQPGRHGSPQTPRDKSVVAAFDEVFVGSLTPGHVSTTPLPPIRFSQSKAAPRSRGFNSLQPSSAFAHPRGISGHAVNVDSAPSPAPGFDLGQLDRIGRGGHRVYVKDEQFHPVEQVYEHHVVDLQTGCLL